MAYLGKVCENSQADLFLNSPKLLPQFSPTYRENLVFLK